MKRRKIGATITCVVMAVVALFLWGMVPRRFSQIYDMGAEIINMTCTVTKPILEDVIAPKDATSGLYMGSTGGLLLLGQGPVPHCGVFRCSEKRSFGEQKNHLLCGWLGQL